MDHLVTRWWKHFLIYTKVLMREKDFYGKFKRKIVRQKEAGGIYLFESKESAHKYLMITTEILKGFGIEPVNGEIFEVNEGLTQIKWSQVRTSRYR